METNVVLKEKENKIEHAFSKINSYGALINQ